MALHPIQVSPCIECSGCPILLSGASAETVRAEAARNLQSEPRCNGKWLYIPGSSANSQSLPCKPFSISGIPALV